MGCIFCDIANGKIDAEVVSKNQDVMVLKDINPQAPNHLLVIPIKHYANINDAAADPKLLAALVTECAKQGEKLGGEDGFRLVVNTGKYGGQTVDHLHFHVLAGRQLQWPPG